MLPPDITVLVVDDSPSILITMKVLFAKFGITAHIVSTGEEAVNLIREEETSYKAVFLDYLMPGLDGIQTFMQIREIETDYARTIPIIAMTAFSNPKVFFDNGFQGYLQKPITLLSLETVIQELFSSSERASELVPV